MRRLGNLSKCHNLNILPPWLDITCGGGDQKCCNWFGGQGIHKQKTYVTRSSETRIRVHVIVYSQIRVSDERTTYDEWIMHAVHRRFIPYQLPIEKGREGSQGMWWIGGWTNKNNACTNKALTILKCSEQNLQKRGYHFACLPPPRLTISICTTRGRALTKKMREAPMILKISDQNSQ